MAILLPRGRRTPRNFAPPLDWSVISSRGAKSMAPELWRGLLHAIVPLSGRPYDIISGQFLTVSTTGTPAADGFRVVTSGIGPVFRFDAVDGSNYKSFTIPFLGDDVTIAAKFRRRNTTPRDMYGVWSAPNDGYAGRIDLGVDDFQDSIRARDNSVTNTIITNSVIGQWYTSMTYINESPDVFRGFVDLSDFASSAIFGSGISEIEIGRAWDGDIAGLYVWSGDRADRERSDWYLSDPYLPIRPRPLMVPVSAGGGTAALSATIASLSSVSAEIQRKRGLAATVASTSSLSAEIRRTLGFDSTISSLSALSAELTTAAAVPLSATISSISGFSAELRRTRGLDSTISSASGLSAELNRTLGFAATIAANSAVAAALARRRGIGATIVASSALSAALGGVRAQWGTESPLAGSWTAEGAVSSTWNSEGPL